MAEGCHRARVNYAALERRKRRQRKVPVHGSFHKLHHEIRGAKRGAVVAGVHDPRDGHAARMQRFEYCALAHHVVGAVQQSACGFFAEDILLRAACALQVECGVALAAGERADDDGAGVGQQQRKGGADG